MKIVFLVARLIVAVPVALILTIVVLPGLVIEGVAKRNVDVYY